MRLGNLAFSGKFRLDGRGMNAIIVQTTAHLFGEMHISLRAFVLDLAIDFNMQRCHELRIAQLPYVKMVGT